jgi:hypothetical protein
MTTCKICVIAILCYPIISGIIALFLLENYEDKISDREKACYAICWPLAIVLLPVFYIIKIIKQNNKLKETNKLEENKRKKELVNTVLKELKLR